LDDADEVLLRDAVRDLLGQPDEGSYVWHRRHASDYGYISLDIEQVPAFKHGRYWYVKPSEIIAARQRARDRQERLDQATRDYGAGVFHGADAGAVQTTWGWYQMAGDFRFVYDSLQVYRRRNDGLWVCNECNVVVDSECPKCGRRRL
jgi:hypothetical protein